MQYSIGFGTGDLYNYIQKPSFRGVTIDYLKFVKEGGGLGLGIDFSWNVFYKKEPYSTFTINNVSFSGKQYLDSNHYPILFATDYFFCQHKVFNPYVGLGIGTINTTRAIRMSNHIFEWKTWQFALSPEIGFIYELDYGVGLLVCTKYYYGFSSSNFASQNYFTLNVGIALLP